MKLSGDKVLQAHASLGSKVVANWAWIGEQTRHEVDLSQLAHRQFVHIWLNKLRCRIEYGPPQMESVLSQTLGSWWHSHLTTIVELRSCSLEEMSDQLLESVVDMATHLTESKAWHSRNQNVGWVATSKVLMAIAPKAISAWDNSIAKSLYGGLSTRAYARHLQATRAAACELCSDSRIRQLMETPGVFGLGKLIDETLYYWCTVRKQSALLA